MSTSEPIPFPPAPQLAPELRDAPPPKDPFRVFGIVGFVLSLFLFLNVAGLVISIVALVRSHRVGFRNRFALAGTIIAALGVLVLIIGAISVITSLVGAAQMCAQVGDGVHTVGSATYTCTPTSIAVHYG